MATPDLKILSDVVSRKMGKSITFITIEKIGSGHHSDGFRLTAEDGTTFFLKYIKSHDLGFEFRERQVMTLLVSHGMGERSAGKNPSPVGVILIDGDEGAALPRITENTEVYHLQEFGGTGKSYSAILENNTHKTGVDAEDISQLSLIADALTKIHSVKHPSKDISKRNAVYNDGIRNVLTHPELSLMMLSEFPDTYPVLPLEEQKELLALMYDNIKSWMNRGDRLTALHGDFWGANIFFRDDGSVFVVDFSRIPWGDPAIDAGWFVAELLWKYHATGNRYYRDLTEAWLTVYAQKSGDTELRKAIPLVVGFLGIVHVYPKWFPNLDVGVARRFMDHIRRILRTKEFVWDVV